MLRHMKDPEALLDFFAREVIELIQKEHNLKKGDTVKTLEEVKKWFKSMNLKQEIYNRVLLNLEWE